MGVTLFLDGNFLGHRARHTTGGLEFEGMPTGVCFAFIRDLHLMTELHIADRVVFAFDTGFSHRKQLNAHYKSSRERTPEEEEELRKFHEEMKRLRKEVLPSLGYQNIWRQRGYEADDLIAAACEALRDDEDGVIVTADNDLWQCLRPNVRWWNPITKCTVTYESFRKTWGIRPEKWVRVKAIAGCRGDDVIGVSGVGEKTAVKWLKGELKPSTAKHQAITTSTAIIKSNMPLVKLPFPGVDLPDILDDQVTEGKRLLVMEELGIRPARKTLSQKRKGFI